LEKYYEMCYKSGVEGIAHFRNADFSRVEAKHRMYCNKSVAEVAKYIVKWN